MHASSTLYVLLAACHSPDSQLQHHDSRPGAISPAISVPAIELDTKLLASDGGSQDNYGSSVSGAGDVNGDGYNDVIVGAPFADNINGTNGGAAYVYLGTADGIDSTAETILLASDGTSAGYTSFGFSVADAGDVNGDGYDDVISSTNSGVYVYLGSAAGISVASEVKITASDMESSASLSMALVMSTMTDTTTSSSGPGETPTSASRMALPMSTSAAPPASTPPPRSSSRPPIPPGTTTSASPFPKPVMSTAMATVMSSSGPMGKTTVASTPERPTSTSAALSASIPPPRPSSPLRMQRTITSMATRCPMLETPTAMAMAM